MRMPEREDPAHREPRLEGGHGAAGVDHGVAEHRSALVRAGRDHAAGVIVMSAQVLGRGMQDDSRTPGHAGLQRRGRGERVVDGRRAHRGSDRARPSASRSATRSWSGSRWSRCRRATAPGSASASASRSCPSTSSTVTPNRGITFVASAIRPAVERRRGHDPVHRPRPREVQSVWIAAMPEANDMAASVPLQVGDLRLERVEGGVPVPARVRVAGRFGTRSCRRRRRRRRTGRSPSGRWGRSASPAPRRGGGGPCTARVWNPRGRGSPPARHGPQPIRRPATAADSRARRSTTMR